MRKRHTPRAGRWFPVVSVLLLLALAGTLLIPPADPIQAGRRVPMPDGGSLELVSVLHTNKIRYQHQRAPRLVRLLAPLLPDSIEKRFSIAGAMSVSGSETNLTLVTVRSGGGMGPEGPQLVGMRLIDDQGHAFDGGHINGTLGMADDLVNFWRVAAFNRRSAKLGVEWVIRDRTGHVSVAGPVTFENPAKVPAGFPQWEPQPLPQCQTNGALSVTLERFRSLPGPSGGFGETGEGRPGGSTRIEFAFTDAGTVSEHFRIQRIVLRDITGNQLSPPLDHLHGRGLNRVRGGDVVLAGALWPGERAWKIEVNVVQTANLPPGRVWEVPVLPLDFGSRYRSLTNGFSLGEATEIRLANLIPPGLIASNQWQWVVRHWGGETNVFALGIQFPDPMPEVRLQVLEARDEAGNPVPLLEHRSENEPMQALFLQPATGAKGLRLKLGFPELRSAAFLAAPEYLGGERQRQNE